MTRTFVVVALLWAALPSALAAQTGRIIGVTLLSTGNEVGGVSVAIIGTSRSTVSATPNGTFTFDAVAPGNYQLRATRQGLQPTTVSVQVGTGPVNVSIVLAVAPGPPAVSGPPGPPALISPAEPPEPLPLDSLKLPVPDSAILRMRQSEGKTAFTPRVGGRARLVLFRDLTVTVEITQATATPEGSEAWGNVITDGGARGGVVTIVVRGDQVVANVRRGLRLYQIRPQARGIHLVVEVDQTKMPARDSDASSGGAR